MLLGRSKVLQTTRVVCSTFCPTSTAGYGHSGGSKQKHIHTFGQPNQKCSVKIMGLISQNIHIAISELADRLGITKGAVEK